ncbi:MAG: DUF4499 domain-containing protein [Acidimicrobiia bacterium]|jgi:hypothetical protein
MASETFVPVAPIWWVTNFGGVVMTGVTAVRSRSKLKRGMFAAAVALHVGEAVYAHRIARNAGLGEDAPKWGLQTLGVGFPSLIALRGLINERETAGRIEG